jgi:hypothetical protein
MGYYLKNGRARAEVCDRYDVDISAFVRAFEERHADLHDRAVALLADVGEDRIYDAQRRAMKEHVAYDMLYIHGETMGIKDSCEKLVRQASVLLPTMNFATIEPSVSRALLTAPAPEAPAPEQSLPPSAPPAPILVARQQHQVERSAAAAPVQFRGTMI